MPPLRTRPAREARLAFGAALRRGLEGVSAGFLLDQGDRFAFASDPAPLGRDGAIALSVNHFVVTESSAGDGVTVRTVGYAYAIRDRERRELLAYHWHPGGSSPFVWPHLHLGGRLLRTDVARPFGRTHWPTERVTLTAVLRAAIAGLGVEPLRDDWEERLAAADGLLRASLD